MGATRTTRSWTPTTHDHENLYIAGGATMPSASCINSTLSMVAVSLLMADRLKQAMKS